MKIFVAASYSSQVNYETGEVFAEYKKWLEGNLIQLEEFGHTVFCALRADGYRINDEDPAKAFKLDEAEIEAADALLAFITEKVSEGVQTEIGMAIAQKKPVVLAYEPELQLGYFNNAIVQAGQASGVGVPFTSDPFELK